MCDNTDDRCNRVIGCSNCTTLHFVSSTSNTSQSISFETKAASNLVFYLKDSRSSSPSEAIIRVSVGRSTLIETIANIIGWIYFFAWSVSFYPQIYLNFARKNVSGLSFDFLSLNLTGFLFYAVYNVALYFGSSFQSEYFKVHPLSQIPVELNDVVFAVHALFATILTVIQCCVYERSGQSVSLAAKSLLILFWVIAGVSLITVGVGQMASLTFISILSYVKLSITLVKYMPQAYLNYRRESTIGWSIGNVLLDFTGGTFSILQIFLLNFNFGTSSMALKRPSCFAFTNLISFLYSFNGQTIGTI
jgi:cystinosin